MGSKQQDVQLRSRATATIRKGLQSRPRSLEWNLGRMAQDTGLDTGRTPGKTGNWGLPDVWMQWGEISASCTEGKLVVCTLKANKKGRKAEVQDNLKGKHRFTGKEIMVYIQLN